MPERELWWSDSDLSETDSDLSDDSDPPTMDEWCGNNDELLWELYLALAARMDALLLPIPTYAYFVNEAVLRDFGRPWDSAMTHRCRAH